MKKKQKRLCRTFSACPSEFVRLSVPEYVRPSVLLSLYLSMSISMNLFISLLVLQVVIQLVSEAFLQIPPQNYDPGCHVSSLAEGRKQTQLRGICEGESLGNNIT